MPAGLAKGDFVRLRLASAPDADIPGMRAQFMCHWQFAELVEPGKTSELVWQFTKAGTFDFACLQPGHYDAGMKGNVVVAGVATPAKADGHTDHKH